MHPMTSVKPQSGSHCECDFSHKSKLQINEWSWGEKNETTKQLRFLGLPSLCDIGQGPGAKIKVTIDVEPYNISSSATHL